MPYGTMLGCANLLASLLRRTSSVFPFHSCWLLLFASTVTAAGSPPSSLLPDGDFDRPGLAFRSGGPAGSWSVIIHRPGTGSITPAPGEGRRGSAAARYEKTDSASQNIHFDQVVPVTPHTVYEVTAWMRGDGVLQPGLVVYTPTWKTLAATALPSPSKEWTEVHLAFDPGASDRVRLAWIPGLRDDRYEARPGRSFLDDVAITPLPSPPEALRKALEISRSREGDEIDPARLRPAPVSRPAELLPIRCRDGVLVYPDGSEVALWGVNFQTPLAWEYHGRLKPAGVPLETGALRQVTNSNLAEIRELGCDLVRIHLCPSDFTGSTGELTPTVYLEALDHLLARCAETRTRVYLTLINDMNQRTCPGSFLSGQPREKWLFDAHLLECQERYVKALLSRHNPVTGRRYAEEPALGVIEVTNEPDYPAWPEVLLDPAQKPLREAFEQWKQGRGLDRWPEAAFALWRQETVSTAIRRLVAAIRSTGASQPIFWNLNWPGMITGREDVFQAVAESPVDGVSFCLYPGQQDVPHPFWAHPMNLDGKNYLPFLRDNLRQYDKLRWLLGRRFAGKAKAVYEFETFYTQNSHLYPAMARLMRSLGAQLAPMWTYTLTPSAERHSGSHHLNLYCTPRKALSFAIAGKLFHETPRHAAYPEGDDRELVFDNRCLVSVPRDLSVWQSDDTLMHSRSLDALPFPTATAGIRHILACGSSPLVQYGGSGIYAIDSATDTLTIRVNPDASFVRPHWQRAPSKESKEKSSALDWSSPHRMKLQLPGWPGGAQIQQLLDGQRRPLPSPAGVLEFDAVPGRYEASRAPSPSP